MFPTSDSISEVIAHFIGSFEISVDEMRMRHAYEDFYREQDRLPPDAPIQHLAPGFHQRLDLQGSNPDVHYRPRVSDTDIETHVRPVGVHLQDIPLAHPSWTPHVNFTSPGFGPVAMEFSPGPYLGEPPGSVVLVANQIMLLDDTDVVVLGDIEIGTAATLADAEPLQALLEAGMAISEPLTGLEAPLQVEAIPAYFASAEAAIAAIAGQQGSDGSALVITTVQHQSADISQEVTTVTGQSIAGVYVDGFQASEAPGLHDALPEQLQASIDGAEPVPSPAASLIITPGEMGLSMSLEAGANMMVNEASLANASLTSTFLAVAGDYHSINAIIQTNIYSDIDVLDTRLPGASENAGDFTVAHNIAVFTAEARDGAAEMAAQNPDAHPANWQVSVVQGDLVFVDWITQYSFTTDSDTHVLSAVGTTTTITSGENLGLNNVSFADIGLYYDVIIVGGSLYDGNFIIQTNVLYDNDILAMLSGAGQGGQVSSGGNMLWNGASILNIGADNVQSGLPDPYSQAIASLGEADYAMPGSFETDASFQGFDGLRVLFIAGNLYDLHSVHQVNVLGDADLVALYRDGLASDHPQVDWNISTGSNALINVASIIDYDSVGSDVHVGGQIYSDAILIQADLVAGSDAAPTGDQALVNEVIAFLDIDVDTVVPGDADHSFLPVSDGQSVDIMQSVLA